MAFLSKQTTPSLPPPEKRPRHIGFILDGNGRWAKKRGLPRKLGHREGAKTFKTIARYCNSIGIRYLTVYAFSTENWNRPAAEVEALMNLLRDYLRDVTNFTKEILCCALLATALVCRRLFSSL